MKNKILIPAMVLFVMAAIFSFKLLAEPQETTEKATIMNVVMKVVEYNHYAPKEMNDSFSSKAFDKLLENFDAPKRFFLQSDVDALEAWRYRIDDEVKDNSLELFHNINGLYIKRVNDAEDYSKKILQTPFEFVTKDSIQTDAEKLKFAKDEQALYDRWTKMLKHTVLSKYSDLKKEQEQKIKDSANYIAKSDVELEQEARNSITKLYERYFKRLKKMGDNERFATFINSITAVVDPHTDYLLPTDKKRFDEIMSGSFIGIGASLNQDDEGRIKIVSIIVGSPSWKQGKLKADDIINKVGQGEEPPVDVTGYEIDDVIKMIRGQEGTEVRLYVTHKDGLSEVIPIIRGKVDFDEILAKSAIVEEGGQRIGYIYLPEFYADFSGQNGGNRSGRDVFKEVMKLREENVDGIILDLRNNGGGSLSDCIDMAAIFLGKSPVVQVRNAADKTNVLSSNFELPYYSGPLTVMVNYASASASEILAAVIQDTERGLVVGTPTFGKGTVQNIVQLDRYVSATDREQIINALNKDKPDAEFEGIGSLKLTIQKFYRINGGSTQLKGVIPDILLPDVYQYEENMGEKKDKSALPWDKIAATQIKKWPLVVPVKDLKEKSKERVVKEPLFKAVEDLALRYKKQKDETFVPLNEVDYRARLKRNEDLSKHMEELTENKELLKFKNPEMDLEKVNLDSASREKNDKWMKNLAKDIQLSETVQIMKDWISMGKSAAFNKQKLSNTENIK